MKKMIFVLAAMMLMPFFTVHDALAQQAKQKGADLSFEKEREELGKMYLDELKREDLEIKFSNEGDQPLVLSQVRGCCGTRIVDWPRTPILPGEEGVIKVSFRLASRVHKVSRTVTVLSNNAGGASIYRIVGEVVDRSTEAFEPAKSEAMAPTSGDERK